MKPVPGNHRTNFQGSMDSTTEEYVLLDFEGQLDVEEAINRISGGKAHFEIRDDELFLCTDSELFTCLEVKTIGSDLYAYISNDGIKPVASNQTRLLAEQLAAIQ